MKLSRKKPKKYAVKYQTVIVYFDEPTRTGICVACGASEHKKQIKFTQGHHWSYDFKPQTVKEDKKLALLNRVEFCAYDHRFADALRVLCEAPINKHDRIVNVINTMPEEFKYRLEQIYKKWKCSNGV
jgi:hypothetical protein